MKKTIILAVAAVFFVSMQAPAFAGEPTAEKAAVTDASMAKDCPCKHKCKGKHKDCKHGKKHGKKHDEKHDEKPATPETEK